MTKATQSHEGPERRRHRVYVTENSEYHCRDGVCVAVRDVRTGAFQPTHGVLGETARLALSVCEDGSIDSVTPVEHARPGQRLQFSSATGETYQLTSVLRSIERPPRQVVAEYPSVSARRNA